MKTIALLGGSFNPVHRTHVELAKVVLDLGLVDEVQFLPCHGHAFGKDLASDAHRLHMLNIVVADLARSHNVSINTIEMDFRMQGRAWETVEKLVGLDPYTVKYKYVIGLDCALEINRWYNWCQLIQYVPFIVFPRQGYELTNVFGKMGTSYWFEEEPHIFLKDHPVNDLSSTFVRRLIQQFHRKEVDRSDVVKYIHTDVFDYINDNNLYRN